MMVFRDVGVERHIENNPSWGPGAPGTTELSLLSRVLGLPSVTPPTMKPPHRTPRGRYHAGVQFGGQSQCWLRHLELL